MERLVQALRDASWLDGRRARDWRLSLFAATLLIAALWIAVSPGGIDPAGKPLGTDFLAFWSAARLAIAGHAAGVYDLATIHAVEFGAMPVDPGPSSFLYPPPFLLLCLGFGLMPYFVALAVWLGASGTAFALVISRWLPQHPALWLTIAAFPALLINIGHGQNGFITAALLGGGLLLLDRRPYMAGALLGCLIVKPQIALALPLMLIAGRHWRSLGMAALTATIVCAAATFAFGSAIWPAFAAGSALGRAILEQGLVEPGKMVSLFAAIRVFGGTNAQAYTAQALLAALAMIAVVRTAKGPAAAATAVAGSTMISPFFLDYDLTILAIPLAWMFGEGLRRGWRPWEKVVLLAAYLLPLYARDLALELRLPIAPIVLFGLLTITARAGLDPIGSRSSSDHRHAAVDVEGLPGDVAGLAAG